MPNPNTLSWIHYQDIQISDSDLQTQLKQYFTTGQYSEALELLSNNATQLQGKAFISNVLNIISTNILDLENRYYTGVPLFLSNLSDQYFTLINNFISKGAWNSNTQYIPFNFVTNNNLTYMCISKPPIGTSVTDSKYWLELDLLGNVGAPGIDVVMKYDWNGSNTYNVNDLVIYNNNIYVALQNNTNVVPGTNDSVWEMFVVVTPGTITVGLTAPLEFTQNTIWFKTNENPLEQTSNSPLVGQFYRYNSEVSNWEEMYPNILFRWLDGYTDYAPLSVLINVNIQPNQWQNNEYIYEYPFLNNNSFVTVFPVFNISDEQYSLYNELNISLDNTNIVLSVESTPNINLPIIIKIQ